MALASCRECSNPVSTEAASCPHCGVAHPAGGAQAVVIEKTDKRWKRLQLAGWSLLVVGFVGMCTAVSAGKDGPTPAWAQGPYAGKILTLSIAGGVVLIIYAKIAAWWHHG